MNTQSNQVSRFNDIMNDLKYAGKRALKDIPVDLLAIDSSYQTDQRINSDSRKKAINKLAENWNENKLESITVVPHLEEHKFYVVNGYGRWQASQKQPQKYEYLSALLLLGAPQDEKERRKFESELFAYQDNERAPLKPIDRHGALLNLGDTSALLLEELKNKYNFSFVADKGNRGQSVLGSYTEVFGLAKSKGRDCLEYIFDICKGGGFDRKTNGYASYVMRSLRDMWMLFPDERNYTKELLTEMFRKIEPSKLKSNATKNYPELDWRVACSLYLEDFIVGKTGVKRLRMVDGKKVIKIG